LIHLSFRRTRTVPRSGRWMSSAPTVSTDDMLHMQNHKTNRVHDPQVGAGGRKNLLFCCHSRLVKDPFVLLAFVYRTVIPFDNRSTTLWQLGQTTVARPSTRRPAGLGDIAAHGVHTSLKQTIRVELSCTVQGNKVHLNINRSIHASHTKCIKLLQLITMMW
jgi:hypothetical protein